jgi:hypothetical protein
VSAARKLAAVPAPAAKPRLRRITKADAERAHPHNPEHQRRWLVAIGVLRTKTRNGWKRDHPVTRIPKEKQQ